MRTLRLTRAIGALALMAACLPWAAAGAQGAAAPRDSATLAVARQLVDVMKMDEVIRAGNIAMVDAQAATNPSLAQFRGVLLEWAETHLTWERMAPRMAEIYAEALTASEMRELMAFYSTPTGQKLIAVTPQLTRRGAEVGAEMAQRYLPELEMMMMRERMEELTGTGPPAKP